MGAVVGTIALEGERPVSPEDQMRFLAGWMLFFPFAALYAILPFSAVGIPMHCALVAARCTGWLAYLCVGAALGALALPWWSVTVLGEAPQDALSPALGAIIGASATFGFWLSARPDRST